MGSLSFSVVPIPGLRVIDRVRREDARGFLARIYCAEELRAAGLDATIAQINVTLTRRRGAVRGMHFQAGPSAEDKTVTCLSGEVFDVAVDLRAGSPTFLRWHAEVLSGTNGRSLFIPRGFAHGFQALQDDCQLLYLHSRPYAPGAEGGLDATDPRLAIDWPLPIRERSERDAGFAPISPSFVGIELQ